MVRGMTCVEMELGEPDASGRRRPVEKPDSAFTIECDCVIMAIGTSPNPLIKNTTHGLETQKWGGIITDEHGLTRARPPPRRSTNTSAASKINILRNKRLRRRANLRFPLVFWKIPYGLPFIFEAEIIKNACGSRGEKFCRIGHAATDGPADVFKQFSKLWAHMRNCMQIWVYAHMPRCAFTWDLKSVPNAAKESRRRAVMQIY